MSREHTAMSITSRIDNYKVDFVFGDKSWLLVLILGLAPPGSLEVFKEVIGMPAGRLPDKQLGTRVHDMRKMKLCIHATNVTGVEGPRESFKRIIGQLDLRRIVSVICCDGNKLI